MENQYLCCTKEEVRAVIRFFNFQNISPTEIHRKITEVYGPQVMSRKSVSVWCTKFNSGRESVEDEARSGRPISTSTAETIDAVEKLLRSDRRLKIREMATQLDLPKTTVHEIVHEKLNFRKVCARWVPKMLTADHKTKRLRISIEHLNRARNDESFLDHLITGDETWVHYSTPYNKRDSMTWKHPESPVPKKFKQTISSKKVMATVFWDAQGILLIEFLSKNETINADRYIETLKKLKEKIRFKRRGQLRSGNVKLLHDNATPHSAGKTKAWLEKYKWEVLEHPPYSPDLAPSDFFLFGPLKKHLGGTHFQNEEEVMNAVTEYFDGKCAAYFRDGIFKLLHRWEKCINLNGDYVEK